MASKGKNLLIEVVDMFIFNQTNKISKISLYSTLTE